MNYYAIGDTVYVVAHHGIPGMHWGVRRFQPYGQGGYSPKKITKIKNKIEKTKGKIAKNQAKIEKLNRYSKTKKMKKLKLKQERLEIRRSRYDKRVNKAKTNREVYGKKPTLFQRHALKKAYKLDTKISKVIRKQEVWKRKVDKLEYKNYKLENKVNKLVTKLDAA